LTLELSFDRFHTQCFGKQCKPQALCQTRSFWFLGLIVGSWYIPHHLLFDLIVNGINLFLLLFLLLNF
jgi:hypothetical protein